MGIQSADGAELVELVLSKLVLDALVDKPESLRSDSDTVDAELVSADPEVSVLGPLFRSAVDVLVSVVLVERPGRGS